MKSSKRPTARTLEWLRKQGFAADVVERWTAIPSMPGGGIRRDLFNIIDVVAIIHGRIYGIQCGATSGHAAHRTKCLAEPILKQWLAAGGGMLLHSWAKQGPRGKAKRWTLKSEELTP